MTDIPTLPSLDINEEELTIMGVKFSDLNTLNSMASAITSNMFEGFRPTKRDIELLKYQLEEKPPIEKLIKILEEEFYARQQ